MSGDATQPTLPRLLELEATDSPPPWLGMPLDPVDFLEGTLGRKLRADEARYLAGPVVFHPGGWDDTLPEWLRMAVPKGRIAQIYDEGLVLSGGGEAAGAEGRRPELAEGRRPELAEGRRPELAEGRRPELAEGIAAARGEEHAPKASLEEAAAYLYTASLAAPLARDWSDIYFWVADRVMHTHGVLPEDQAIWDLIDPDEGLSPNVRELTPYLQEELNGLRRDVRRAVVRHQKQREKK
jgi:hypothetical protein